MPTAASRSPRARAAARTVPAVPLARAARDTTPAAPPALPLAPARPHLRRADVTEPDLDAALLACRLDEAPGQPVTLWAVFDLAGVAQAAGVPPGDALADATWALLAIGQPLSLRWAADAALPAFHGTVVAAGLEWPGDAAPRLRVVVADALQRLADHRAERSFRRSSDAALVRRIAAQHGLACTVALPGGPVDQAPQAGESDLALVTQRAAAHGAGLRWADDRLQVAVFGGPEAPAPVLTMGADLRSFTVLADARIPAPPGRPAVQGRAVAEGALPGLRAGDAVDLEGLGPVHGGRYRVAGLQRQFDLMQGLSTGLDLERELAG